MSAPSGHRGRAVLRAGTGRYTAIFPVPARQHAPTAERRIRHAAVATALLLAVGGAAGCASTHPFDSLYERGEYDAAARTFAADSALHDEPRALLRAAVIHAMPGSEAHDPVAARARLERLLEVAPSSDYAPLATALLGSLSQLGRMEARVDGLVLQLRAADAEGGAWRAALERARPGSEEFDPEAAREALRSLLDRYPESRYRPEALTLLALLELAERNRTAVAVLVRQLEQLKAVDLSRTPD